MNSTIRYNGSITGSTRKSKITFSTDKMNLFGPQSFYNEKGDIIAEITYNNGVKEGPAFLFIENYAKGKNAVELFEYKNNLVQKSEVYLINGNDLYDRDELIRITHFENDIVSEDVKFEIGVPSERFTRKDNSLTNHYYKDGELDMLIKINPDGSSIHVSKSDMYDKYNIIQLDTSKKVVFRKVHFEEDNSCSIFKDGDFMLTSNPQHTSIVKFNQFELNFKDSLYNDTTLKVVNSKLSDGFREEFNFDMESANKFTFSSYEYTVGSYSVQIQKDKISIHSPGKTLISPTNLEGFEIGMFRKLKLWYNNFDKDLVVQIIKRYKSFINKCNDIISRYMTEAASIIYLTVCDYEDLI